MPNEDTLDREIDLIHAATALWKALAGEKWKFQHLPEMDKIVDACIDNIRLEIILSARRAQGKRLATGV